jgi:hypothetical protein
MKDSNLTLDRLLRAAAAASSEQAHEMPYGFDSRVLAQARANQEGDLVAVGRLLRRVVLLSLGVIALAGAGAYHELRLGDDPGDSLTDEFVIADSAIGNIFEQ